MNKDERARKARERLIAFAIEWLAEWSGHEPGDLLSGSPKEASQWLEPYRKLLGGGRIPPESEPGSPLLSIFSRVKPEDGQDPPQKHWPAVPLSLKELAYPVDKDKAQGDANLWRGFEEDWSGLPAREGEHHFETFTYLLHKWAWAVPCSYGEPGVSLYDEFRALSALVHASGCAEKPAGEFLLVGGDVPGIQKTIYTITSKGATKGLRGRSFFIQLLGDAVVRRLLDELELPGTNVIYVAGGNFELLAPKGKEKEISKLATEINEQLLQAFEGDLALCLACHSLPATQIGSGAFSQETSRALHKNLSREKRRRFAKMACEGQKGWEEVFAPKGRGAPIFCIVCQHERKIGEQGVTTEDGWKCEHCAGFEELARVIAQDPSLMLISPNRPNGGGKRWQELLWQLTEQWYDFSSDLQKETPAPAKIYSLNDLNFLTAYAHGFRFLANTTPKTKYNQVKTFDELADGATGLKRVGVLRMDVDDLGRVLTLWMPERTMAATSALSDAIDRFFTGWLDAICREVSSDPQMRGTEAERSDLLYVIYAGGDDLFVVGAWDLMPLLAERIRQRFNQYVGHHPDLHISAGITLEGRKFPLYQAAKRAGGALDHGAKGLPRRQVEGKAVNKDGLNFLGQTLGWETYPFVKEQVERLIRLTQEQKVPRSLLSVLRAIYARYKENVKQARKRGLTEAKMYYGPWMWRKVYQLSRIRQRYRNNKDVAQDIEALETEVLTVEKMPYIELATRWAEYLTREGRG